MCISKKEQRAYVKDLNRQYLTTSYREEGTRRIIEQVVSHKAFRKASIIATFHALPDEPFMERLAEHPLAQGKHFLLPRVEGDDIAFYPYDPEGALTTGAYGISEPQLGEEAAVVPNRIDLVIVPGMAFSPEGLRLGRGKGYYDRFLPQTSAYTIGVTFRFRLLDNLMHDPWDIPVKNVITD